MPHLHELSSKTSDPNIERWGCWGKRIRHSLLVSGGSGVAVGGSPSSVSFSMASSGSGRLSASADRHKCQMAKSHFDISNH